jgi:hypothetical protein
MSLYTDHLFAPLDLDLNMERIAGGNETEVYLTDDHRFVVKVKSDEGGTVDEALVRAQTMRATAAEFAAALGSEHTIPSYHLIARDSDGLVQVVVVQPFMSNARPLFELDYERLNARERACLAEQLEEIIRRSLKFYHQTGRMPDLYGRVSRSKAERRFLNAPRFFLWRLWGFLAKRTLLRSHNLLLTNEPRPRIVLIDYDAVRRSWLYRTVYFATRCALFLRDYLLLQVLRRGGKIPRGQ